MLWAIAGRSNLADSGKRGNIYFRGYKRDFSEKQLYAKSLSEFGLDLIQQYFVQVSPRQSLSEAEADAVAQFSLGIPFVIRQAAVMWRDGKPIAPQKYATTNLHDGVSSGISCSVIKFIQQNPYDNSIPISALTMQESTTFRQLNAKQYAPATDRNREPILQVLNRVLPPEGCVLEVASGTGQHAAYFAPKLAPRQWLPSDPNPLARESTLAWRSEVQADNLLPPLQLDASTAPWPVERLFTQAINSIVNINMIHIAPWICCQGLLAGAERILPAGGVLYLYGPYRRQGEHTAPSNAAFDQQLRARNPEWGIRDLETVVDLASECRLDLQEVVEMPANNLSVIFRRR